MSQPSAKDIDTFRMTFYEKMIQQEKKKELETQLKQKCCYHRYELYQFISNEYMEWICVKCDRVVKRRVAFS